MENKKSYYAIIPANVRYDNNLIQGAKLLYGEITALCNEKGFCWASNDYFANLYNVSKPTIQNWLKSLEDGRYITREVKYKENSKEIEARYIRIFGEGHQENLVRGHQEIYQDNNTSFNNTSNNNTSYKSDAIPYLEIIDYLNLKAEKRFKCVPGHKKYIKARWNEGQREDDFKKVIDVKTQQWIESSEMNKYLRPQTLFGNKFDEYLNEYRPTIASTRLNEIEETQRRLREVYGDDYQNE